jgi:hypothetical protein
MKTLHFNILSGFIAIAALSSCSNCIKGSGTEVKEARKMAAFSQIDISGGYDVTLKQDSSFTLNVTTDDNLLKEVKTDVSGDKLKIHTEKNICTSHPITIIIGIKNLEEIKGSGGITVTSDGKLNVKDLNLDFSGAGKVNLDMVADNVTTKGSGIIEMNLKGQASSHTVNVSGTGKINALDFIVGKYDLETTGESQCKINVLNELNVHTTGASEIEYKGNPAHINSKKTGAASIKKID